MKFNVVIMNPPYSNQHPFLDIKFVKKTLEVGNKLVAVYPAKRMASATKMSKEQYGSKHLKTIDILDGNEIFGIHTKWKYVGVFVFDNLNDYENIEVNFNDETKMIKCDDFELRKDFYVTLDFSKELKQIISNKESLYKELLDKYKTMVNDGHGFVYEETDLSRGKKKYNIVKNDDYGLTCKRREQYKSWLKHGKYKYCLYKGSYNNDYDEVQEWKGQDPDKLFRCQILWLTNKENVKENIKYWLESPLADLWRIYKFKLLPFVFGCAYGKIPALDFEKPIDEFRKYVDKLNNFTKEEIEVLKENKIHNSYKL